MVGEVGDLISDEGQEVMSLVSLGSFHQLSSVVGQATRQLSRVALFVGSWRRGQQNLDAANL